MGSIDFGEQQLRERKEEKKREKKKKKKNRKKEENKEKKPHPIYVSSAHGCLTRGAFILHVFFKKEQSIEHRSRYSNAQLECTPPFFFFFFSLSFLAHSTTMDSHNGLSHRFGGITGWQDARTYQDTNAVDAFL